MVGRKSQKIPADLLRATERFSEWRRQRVLGARIPESLWGSAVKLAGRHGLSRTATSLKLGYDGLKKRVEARATVPVRKPVPRPAFLELAASPVTAVGECLIEFENAAGSRMRVHLKGSDVPDLVALGRSFWNAE
ncbi:MAG TPA: hypothetical protein VMQ56_15340 [Terracidiphilus sp.]|jgi:hypothetical protein|nr:hypothetical protein [Terracidiphilus sp.]